MKKGITIFEVNRNGRDNIATYGRSLWHSDKRDKKIRDSTAEPPSTVKTREIKRYNIEMRRGLYTSNYTGIPAYLMDFGFGGFLGYGRRVRRIGDGRAE